jgi:predicted 2-oxoglutarate/Fe(II)-dependent dioxygenase YbiX
MILCIADILDPPGLASLRDCLAGGVYVDGVLTSGWASRLVKKNEQLGAGPAAARAQEQVVAALARTASSPRRCCRTGSPRRSSPATRRAWSSAPTWTTR